MPDSNDAMQPVWSALRVLLITIGAGLADHGLEHSEAYKIVEMLSGSILIIGPAIWGVWVAIRNAQAKAEVMRQGVAAGMIAGASGVHSINPADLSHADAKEVVKVFAPGKPEA